MPAVINLFCLRVIFQNSQIIQSHIEIDLLVQKIDFYACDKF
jgi:hypothetical protein